MAKRMSFSDQMRRLIETCGQSCYTISKATGLDPATISRFMNQKGGMSNEGLDAVAAYLGWEIIAHPTVAKAAKPQAKSKKGEGK